jgi:hypothetical protein
MIPHPTESVYDFASVGNGPSSALTNNSLTSILKLAGLPSRIAVDHAEYLLSLEAIGLILTSSCFYHDQVPSSSAHVGKVAHTASDPRFDGTVACAMWNGQEISDEEANIASTSVDKIDDSAVRSLWNGHCKPEVEDAVVRPMPKEEGENPPAVDAVESQPGVDGATMDKKKSVRPGKYWRKRAKLLAQKVASMETGDQKDKAMQRMVKKTERVTVFHNYTMTVVRSMNTVMLAL